MQDCYVDTTLAVTHITKWERAQASYTSGLRIISIYKVFHSRTPGITVGIGLILHINIPILSLQHSHMDIFYMDKHKN